MSDTKPKKKKRKQKQRLLPEEGGEEADGIANPILTGEESDTGLVYSGGETSGGETAEDIEEAENLAQDLKSKHAQKQRELSDVVSPKDDVAKELRNIKKKSKEKVEETIRQEQEESAAEETTVLQTATEVGEDGTLPMPEGEETGEGIPTLEGEEIPTLPEGEEDEEESKVKKLKKKKKTEESEITPLTQEGEEETKPEEPAPPKPPEEDTKTSRGKSLKDRLKNRLQKAKETAVSEVQEKEREERREKRLKRDQQVTRFDTEYDEAEMERLEERSRQVRMRLKKLNQQPSSEREMYQSWGIFVPTTEEAYDFFTRNFDPEPDEEEKKEEVEEKADTEKDEKEDKDEEEEAGPSTEPKEGEEGEEGAEGEEEGDEAKKKRKDKRKKDKETDEEKTPLLDEVMEDDFSFRPVVVRGAEFPDPIEMQKKEAELYFVPSVTTVPSEQKVSEEQQPRFLEDEGFYVGTRPDPSGWNVNKMEHRLLKEPDGHRWFGEDGRMLALPDPLRPTPSRPPVPEEKEPYLETVFKGAIMREFDSKYIDGSVDNSGFYQLDVDINSISMSHHHMYSREHVLSTRLQELYNIYLSRQIKNMTEYLTEKLKALKSSTLHLKDHMLAHKSEHNFADRSNYERRLRDYKLETRKARELRDKEEETDRQILKGMIHTWKEIRAQRESQGYSNTAVKVQFKKEEVDKNRDMMVWRQEIEEEVDEVREAHAEDYQNKMKEYQEQKKEKDKQIKAKAEAAKRQKKRGSKASKSSRTSRASKLSGEDQSPEEKQKDIDILNEEDLPEPELPDEFDETATREKIKAKVMEIRRRPGEPKLQPELTQTNSITPTATCPSGEQKRRDALSGCKVFVKVLFNNKEVSRTLSKPLSQDFKVTFGQIFNIKIVQWPESIKFQVFETVGYSTEMLAELYTSIPEVSITSQGVQLENLDFSCDHRVNHSHEGVGSGVPFSYGTKLDNEMITLMTTGELCSSVAWAVDENNQPLVPPVSNITKDNVFSAIKKMDPMQAVSPSGKVDLEKLSKWFEESRLDPNDPSNADLVYMLKPKGGDLTQLQAPDYFRLEQLQEEFNMATDDEIENNKRFQLLQLRDNEVQEFRNYRMVPLKVQEIPRDTFTEYEKKKREETKLARRDDIESHREDRAKFMQRVREQVIQRFRILAHMKRLEDVVIEEAVPNIAMIGTSLLRVTERRRPLRPERKERKKVTAQVLKGDDVKILVNITRALYVPIRTSSSIHADESKTSGSTTARGTDTDSKAVKSIVGDTLVRPFVEVVFQHSSIRTVVGDGPNPSFNEELQIPFKAPNDDYSSNNLQTITDELYLNLFDEVVVDIQEDDRNRGTTLHQRIEKRWLGDLTIPFSTIYFNGKIEGTFCLKSPPVLLGYTHDQNMGADTDINIGSKEENTYLSLFITIEPPLSPAEPMKERFSTNEAEDLLQYAEKWQTELEEKFPKREFKTTVVNVNGKSVFITRYFKELKPPEELLADSKNQKADEVVAHFVAMIPFVSDSVVFPGLCDIWSTSSQFLQMMAGDEEEHAVLLVNFFMSMGKKTWLIIGTAIPEGPTAYVMTEEGNDLWIWNAGTGLHYSVHDNYCPLQTVGCLVDAENIYANIQQYDKPSQMRFDIKSTSDWKPFFTRSFARSLPSIQPEALRYINSDPNGARDIQEKIENMLKNRIMEWRSRYITRWNRHCTQIMRKILPVLEENLGKPPDAQHLSELEKQFSTYKVSGFPINMPFTGLDYITERVYSTGVHAHETSDVEFALAVYVHAYPNSIASVWVYVASLIRLR
ncbi:coiled-coil and C2 domain-containing protein 2A-like isoform X2 [Argopecten irradians]|uniref:coiled-coil and C2 domain-containing protein 2A-like isoform X2 n=1 Tax=Argopecten irradians TaxID=31199 RepID=UPI0037145F8D